MKRLTLTDWTVVRGVVTTRKPLASSEISQEMDMNVPFLGLARAGSV
jgi:hypothetical protein